jgi:putative acetyltransferase
MITVRPAVSDDLRLLVPVWRSAVEATHHFLTPDDIDWYEPHVADYLRTATYLRVATCQADEHAPDPLAPLGFIAFEAGAIQMLFVTAASQGAGVGTALLAEVIQTARHAGCAELTVDVNESNAAGRSFYAARGFHVVGRSPLDDQGRPFPLLHLRLPLTRG